ncbi:hypothetical protein MK280_04140, partial [Myxococcota bacterium]|nr:hypothetical protein [Myxococcota bacterium]
MTSLLIYAERCSQLTPAFHRSDARNPLRNPWRLFESDRLNNSRKHSQAPLDSHWQAALQTSPS